MYKKSIKRGTVMKKGMLLAFLLFVSFIFMSGDAYSAWTQPKGASYNQLTLSHYKTTQKFTTLELADSGAIVGLDTDVHRVDSEEFNSTKISYYGEYGITDKLTVFASGGWDWQRTNDTMRYANNDGPSGITDINLGLRRSLIDNIAGTGILMSMQGTIKIPEAYDYGDPATEQSLGDGQYDTTLALLFGRGLGKGYAWLNMAYKYRFENDQNDPLNFKPSDQFKLSFGGGYSVTSWLSIRGAIEWTKSLGNAKVSEELQTSFYGVGGQSWYQDVVIIKDSLSLEPNILSAGIDLAFNITPKWQTVVSYNEDLTGFGDFQTEDFSRGETFSLAIVYMHR
jgi:hypothetical protein